MRLFVLSLLALVCFGIGAAFAADEVGVTDSVALAQQAIMPAAGESRSVVDTAVSAIDKAKCEAKGMKIDKQEGTCVDDGNVEMRYERTWDPLFGDTPVPKPLFNNVR